MTTTDRVLRVDLDQLLAAVQLRWRPDRGGHPVFVDAPGRTARRSSPLRASRLFELDRPVGLLRVGLELAKPGRRHVRRP